MSKFDYDDIVCVRPGAEEQLRPGQQAWVVGVTTADKRLGSYYEKFPEGTIYTIEFEDGTSVDAHEDDLVIKKPKKEP